MTLSVQQQVNPIGTKLVVETASGATPDNNVTGTSGSICLLEIDNTANAADSYLKLYDRAAPVVGTDPPDFIFRCKASQRRSLAFPQGWDFTALSFATVTAPGTAGTVSPSSAVIVRIVTT